MSSTIGNAVYEELWIRELMAYANQSHILQTWEPVCYLDKGQFSRIFRIRHRKTGMPGALKFVPNPVELSDCDTEGSAKDEFHRSRFESSKFEAEIMSRFHGERNIVQYLETPEFLRRTFRNDRGEEVVHYAVLICMPLYRNSKDWLPLATEHPDVRIRLGLDITQALMLFEEKGVFHRDIKPGNIMLDSAGNFVLGDVGEAKLESDMTTMGFHGTRPYMAPEVLRLEMEHGKMRSDHRSDIYSLGIVLYRLYNRHQFPFLTGEGSLTEDASRSYTLYEKRTRSEGQILYLTDSERARRLRYDGLKLPPPSDADARLSQIILKACAYHRKDRYQSAAELYAALMEYINAPPQPFPAACRSQPRKKHQTAVYSDRCIAGHHHFHLHAGAAAERSRPCAACRTGDHRCGHAAAAFAAAHANTRSRNAYPDAFADPHAYPNAYAIPHALAHYG